MRHTIIIGTGNEHLDDLIKTDMEEASIGSVVATVTTRNTVIKRFMETEASMIFIGEELVGDDGSDDEWERIIEEIRRISLQIRIVYFCDRPAEDLFLTKLTTHSVYDIFNEGKLPPSYLEQLKIPPAYKNIEKFRGKVAEAAQQIAEKSREQRAEEIIREGIKEQQPKKTKVVKEVAKEVVEREKLVHVYERLFVKPQLIVIASAFPGAGSSIIARMLSEYLVNLTLQVGICESPYNPYSYFELIHGLKLLRDQKFDTGWKSWHRQILEDETIEIGTELYSHGVAYMIKHRDDILKDWDMMHTAHLVGFARHYPILIYDMSSSGLSDEREKIILRQANKIILVSGYDPLRVNRDYKQYEETLRTIRDKVIVVSNKSTTWLHKENEEGLKKAYGVNHIYPLPVIPAMPDIYMSGDSFWESAFIKTDTHEHIKSVFAEISVELLTAELIQKLIKKDKQGFIGKIINKFKKENKQPPAELDDSPA
ncbi:hypothetical protein [Paenibacillus periandrae]|uniref:hypothetical protein n=1 Tax=Paenibacillus periandrae TaxID=1761741 RepID=UPI001F09B746|nr:hypothetical protein [Paenibacillus periandrae]